MANSVGKNLSKALFAGAMLLALVTPSFALADYPAPCQAGDEAYTEAGNGVRMCRGDAPAPTATPSTGAAAASTNSGGADDNSSGMWSIFGNATLGAVLSPVAVVSWVVFKIASLILGLAGIIFNWVVAVIVFQFSTYLGNSPGMLMAWGVLRDFGNIALIFGFVYMGIRTILDTGHFSTGRTLASLVIFAVLLNFSLFVAEAVVDTSNVLASTLYAQSVDQSACGNASWLDCAVSTGIAGQILTKINITSAFGGGDGNILAAGISYFQDPLPHILKYIGLALIVTTAAVVLLAGAVMLIARGVVLAFLMVTSPIGFAGMAIPPLQGMARDWWKKLIDQALFAPVFILLLLVSLKMTDGLNQLATSQGGLANAISSTSVVDTGALIMFALIIGFMIGSMMLASKFGIMGADLVTKQGIAVIGGTAGLMTAGTMGWAARRTIGSSGEMASRAIRNSRTLQTMPFIQARLGAVADRAASSSFDIRGKGGALGAPSENAQKGARGEGQASAKRYEDFRKSIEEEDKRKYNLAKLEKERVESVIEASGSNPIREEKLAKAKEAIAQTTEGKIKQESDQKHKLDDKVKDWGEANTQLKDANKNLERIARQLAAEEGKEGEKNTDLIRALERERGEYTTQATNATNAMRDHEGAIADLRDSIVALRKNINKEQKVFRNAVTASTVPNVMGLSPLNRDALRNASVSMKKHETEFKPEHLDHSFSKALREALAARGRGGPAAH